MARTLLVALSAHLLAAATNGMPPRLAACREVVKAKDATEVYSVAQSYSCQNISFPCGSAPVLYADTRNCENFYRCTLMTLEQCPCPVGTTFNVHTQACDNTSSACDCEPTTTTSTTTTTVRKPVSVPAAATPTSTAAATRPSVSSSLSTASPSTAAPTIIKDVVEAVADGGDGGTTGAHEAGDSRSSVEATVVVPAIVCGCVVVVALVGVLAFLHVRGYLGYRKPRKPSQPPGVPCVQAGTTDRHVYAEIDESKITGQNPWSQQQHIVGSAPPLPPPLPPPPPAGPHFYPLYPQQQQQHGTLHSLHFPSQFSGTGSVKRAFPLTNPHMRCYDRSQMLAQALHQQQQQLPPSICHPQMLPHWPDCPGIPGIPHTPGGAGGGIAGFDGTSECSQCSACSSNQASLDVSDSDMHTPLNAAPPSSRGKAGQAYVSKQVYI